MSFVITPEPVVSVPVDGEAGTFPVGRIWCVGRNYAAHAREMGHDPDREPPFFFSKHASAVVPGGGELPFPPHTDNLHHEVELVAALGRGGRDVPVSAALELVYGYAVGLDMTLRDRQEDAKERGRPWDLSKGFDGSCPISAIVPASRIGHPSSGRIEASVDGKPRQDGDLDQMIWSVAEAISFLSGFVELRPGDLLMTGTPSGVGRVLPGETLRGRCAGIGEVSVTYGTRNDGTGG